MTEQDTGSTTPSRATGAAEEQEARAAHEADRPATREEADAAPTSVDPGVEESFEEMGAIGADVKGEGEIP